MWLCPQPHRSISPYIYHKFEYSVRDCTARHCPFSSHQSSGSWWCQPACFCVVFHLMEITLSPYLQSSLWRLFWVFLYCFQETTFDIFHIFIHHVIRYFVCDLIHIGSIYQCNLPTEYIEYESYPAAKKKINNTKKMPPTATTQMKAEHRMGYMYMKHSIRIWWLFPNWGIFTVTYWEHWL